MKYTNTHNTAVASCTRQNKLARLGFIFINSSSTAATNETLKTQFSTLIGKRRISTLLLPLDRAGGGLAPPPLGHVFATGVLCQFDQPLVAFQCAVAFPLHLKQICKQKRRSQLFLFCLRTFTSTSNHIRFYSRVTPDCRHFCSGQLCSLTSGPQPAVSGSD